MDLRYPGLLCVRFGSRKKPTFMPMEVRGSRCCQSHI